MSASLNNNKTAVWSNLEDQIVKAAIQKYGTHQWSKIASLLQHKSARQCQIRWDEYLNPRLNFNDFTKQEDARLLNLARRLPNQWRTIADAMGRTAQTCIDRYNQLLEADDEFGVSSSLQLEYPKAETLAARPDGIQLEDEEREMLAEARARLLNTQGKKATRKVRERMLEESKRIAQLQKRRELKQAGERTTIRKPRKRYETEIDYNEDVAYEQQPIPGIYDTSHEDERMARDIDNFEKRVSLRGLKEDRKGAIGKRKRESDSTSNVPAPTTAEFKKPKLELPKPGTKDDAVETVKANRKALLVGPDEDQSEPLKTIVKPHRTLSELFLSLPTPKNDFEIVLDEDEQDEAPEVRQEIKTEVKEREEGQQIKNSAQNYTINEPESRPLQVDCLRVKAPDFIQNPTDAFERTFNELLASYLTKDPFMQPIGVSGFMEQVEHRMEDVSISVRDLQWQQPTIASVKHSIRKHLTTVRDLQHSYKYLEPLAEFNDKLCRKVCIEQLPHLRKLQQKYYVHYKIYQYEMRAIEIRKRRLQTDLRSALGDVVRGDR
ncbi:pre-mRNA-splicing factor cef1 [Zygosaccharomyces mellis]|uniref:Pre-mRNA-splicing factor CEF1 n=1 Tax=Zygosaccharomyces mellis TaxID=42258 RepID=A0A4C2E7V1_9SACH|nr:pre-mRNA-splicing factor cef1 [Zygosaccharomyces mellis]